MLVILPFLVWVIGVIFWLGWAKDNGNGSPSQPSIRAAILQTTILWGAGLALSTELLSLFHALTRTGICLVWVIALGWLCVVGLRGGYLQRGVRQAGTELRSISWSEWVLLGVIGLFSTTLFAIILISLSGNFDSLHYHLSRIMHWAQNASLRHYATAVVQQLYNPIWAEEAMLHLRLLWGNDQLAGMVQWGAMLTSLVAITMIAVELKVGRQGQWIATAFAFSLPMGVLQSVSTQNDYVVAMWLLCAAWLCIKAVKRPLSYLESTLLGLAVGLGLLTKGTFYLYIVPFGVWFILATLRFTWQQPQPERGKAFKQMLLKSGIIALAIILLNSGYWIRNMLTFGTPLGPSEWISTMTAGQYGLGIFISALIRNVVLNFATPFENIHALIIEVTRVTLGPLDPLMEEFNFFWGWNHEDMAGNPLHVIIIAIVLLILFLTWKRVRERRLWGYVAATAGVYGLFALIIHFDMFGIRYQLPLFILSAPLVGAAFNLSAAENAPPSKATIFSKFPKIVVIWKAVLWVLALLLLFTSLPWITMNRSRPLLALKNGGEPFSIPCHPLLGCTTGSILFEPQNTSLFANRVPQRDPYIQMGRDIRKIGCQDIGLRLDSHDAEYLFWWILDAPQSGTRLESLYTFPELEQYQDDSFQPCAIICTICAERTELHGLPLFGEYVDAKLFVGPGFTQDEGSP